MQWISFLFCLLLILLPLCDGTDTEESELLLHIETETKQSRFPSVFRTMISSLTFIWALFKNTHTTFSNLELTFSFFLDLAVSLSVSATGKKIQLDIFNGRD